MACENPSPFDSFFPGNAEIPAVYFFSARLASERLHRDDVARGLLQEIVKVFPNRELAAEAGRYLAVMDRMAAAKGSAQLTS